MIDAIGKAEMNENQKEKISEETHKDLCRSWKEQAREIKLGQLHDFIGTLVNSYDHDYGTICHAMVACGLAGLCAANKEPGAGITGFQAGFIGLNLLREWLSIDGPFRITEYQKMLYPQNAEYFQQEISEEHWVWILGEARARLAEYSDNESKKGYAHPAVVAHWKSIAEGKVPFGFTVKRSEYE